MSECRSPPIWETLPVERRRGVLLVLGQMALRQIRSASVAEETADDAGRAVAASGRQPAVGQDRPAASGTITARIIGTITAQSPIFITRPEQGDVPLTMNVVRNQAVERVHVIPGETIKGLLRQAAYALCVDATKRNGDLKVSLPLFYRQTAGGIGFTAERHIIGEDATIRQREPILSLFGAAQPRLTGRLTVRHAIAQPAVGLNASDGTGLPPGTRRDAITTNPSLADILSDQEKERWARQGLLVSELSEANRQVEDARRLLGRARRTEGANIEDFEKSLAAAERNVVRIKDEPEFQHAVQRPIPTKPAAPTGTVYDHGFDVADATAEEFGLLLAVLQTWNIRPRIGGGATTGYGYIRADYTIERLSGGDLRRTSVWTPAGKITIGNGDPVVSSEDPDITAAMTAWGALEASLLARTAIFGE